MEKKLKNLKVAAKLKLAFTSVIGMFGFATVISIILTLIVASSFSAFYQGSYESTVSQLEMQRDVQMVGKLVLLALNTDDTAEQEKYKNVMNVKIQGIEDNIASLKETFSNQELVKNLEIELTSWKSIVNELNVEIAGNDHDGAMAIYDGKFYGQTEDLTAALNEIAASADSDAVSKVNISSIFSIINIVVMIVLAVVDIIVCVKVASVITKIITTPLKEIMKATESLRQGVLETEITYESEDEFGELARDFAETFKTLHEIIDDAGNVLSEMADGNFNVHVQKEGSYVGEFTVLLTSMRKLNHELDKTLKQINEMSDQVAVGSDQLAQSSQSLAEGATDQAGAVEELTATIESVTNIASESADVALQAAGQMAAAAKDAAKSGEEVKELIAAMDRITETSKEIENIIAAIEDIASQTNLLSLNAAIEAARAGEAGRGFAVVADQIGKLATDSAQSAVNTRELIGKSLEEISKGNEITLNTVDTIKQIIDNMDQFAQAAAGSAEGSRTQAEMLKQVEAGIEQISSVVQGNSALAQEASAVSEELSAQADSMKDLVKTFKLRD